MDSFAFSINVYNLYPAIPQAMTHFTIFQIIKSSPTPGGLKSGIDQGCLYRNPNGLVTLDAFPDKITFFITADGHGLIGTDPAIEDKI